MADAAERQRELNQQVFWLGHYRELVDRGTPWLDYSNARVQAQTLSLALEAAGVVAGESCLDVGCGRGQLTALLGASGAEAIVATDIVMPSGDETTGDGATVSRRCGDLTDGAFRGTLGVFGRIFLVELLQYVPLVQTLNAAWEILRPGGRIVGVVPNADCPIVQGTIRRFAGQYRPPTASELVRALGAHDDIGCVKVRGLRFLEDQRLVPYEVTDRWDGEERPPNRLLFVAAKENRSVMP